MNWDDQTKLRCVFGVLEIQVRPWYKREIQNKPGMTWQRFVSAFENSYNLKSKRRILKQIANSSQLPNEKARIFINRLADLCLRYDENIDERSIIDACVQGLRPQLKMLVDKIKPKSIEDLCITIEEYETDFRTNPMKTNPDQGGPSQMNMIDDGRRRMAGPNVTCHNCSRQGHYSTNCREPYNAEQVKRNKERFSQQRQGIVKKEAVNTATEQVNNSSNQLPISEEISNTNPWMRGEHLLSAQMKSITKYDEPTQPLIEVKINEKAQICLVDSGATRTVIPDNIAKRHDLERYVDPTLMSMASGCQQKLNYKAKADFSYKDKNIGLDPVIVPDSQPHVLVGNDFLDSLGLIVDYKHHSVDHWPNLINKFLKTDEVIEWMKNHSTERERIRLALDTFELNECNNKENCFSMLDNNQANICNFEEEVGEMIPSHLSQVEANRLKNTLMKYSGTFSKTRTDIGKTSILEHTIDTGNNRPIAQRPYRLAHTEVDHVKSLIQEMLDAGIIYPSTSPWSSPIVLVRKKTGDVRMCVDYRKLNAITEQSAYPIPLMAEIEDLLGNKRYFSTIDTAAMYWQIPMKEEDKCKTAFVVPFALYEYNVMPFGLCGAPATAVRLMNILLGDLLRKSCYVYFDDIIVFSESFNDHLHHIAEILERLEKNNIKIRPKKCRFIRESIEYLGHLISSEGIRPDPARVDTVISFKRPETVTDIRSFTGLASFFRKFIPELAKIVAPINKLIINKKSKREKIDWSEEANSAFETIKKLITESPVLVHYDPNGDLELRTDACDYAIGGILMQTSKDPSLNGVICYVSKMLKKSERNYTVTDKEAYAVLCCVTKLRHYLWNRKFTVTTDHKALQYLMNIKDQNGRLARWALKLQPFRHNIVYKPGICHGDVDYVSRNPLIQSANEEDEELEDIQVYTVSEIDNIEAQQDADDQCKPVIELLKRSDLNIRQELSVKNFKLINGRLFKRVKIDKEFKYVTVVPITLREAVLRSCHDNSAHLGIEKTFRKIASRFYWPNLKNCVKSYVSSCIHCQKKKASNHKPYGRPQLMPAPSGLFDIVGVDTWGKIVPSIKGHKWVLTIVDHYSKWVTLLPLKKHDTTTICHKLTKHFLRIFGNPREMISDRGTNFVSEEANQFFINHSIGRIKTSSHHPKTNGVTERIP